MKRLLLAAGLCALFATGLAAQTGGAGQLTAQEQEDARLKAELDARWARHQARLAAAEAARRAEQERHEQSLRDAEAVRARNEAANEAAMARYRVAAERARRERAEYERRQAEYERRRAEYEARMAEREQAASESRQRRAARQPPERSAAAESQRTCQQRNRRRGRTVGSVIGGIAGVAGGPIGGAAGALTNLLPVGMLLGEAIAGLLDCDEQQQAARATEEAVRGGVGTSATWESDTRANVTGASTVTAAEPVSADGSQCMTVTDIVIIDGEETRAPKRMCRQPPSNRFVRV